MMSTKAYVATGSKGDRSFEQDFDPDFGRDPIPIWDGNNPEEFWIEKRRELELWKLITKVPPNRIGVQWFRRTPVTCPARAILINFSDEELRKETAY